MWHFSILETDILYLSIRALPLKDKKYFLTLSLDILFSELTTMDFSIFTLPLLYMWMYMQRYVCVFIPDYISGFVPVYVCTAYYGKRFNKFLL